MTSTSPLPGSIPVSSSRSTESIAVNPAVPIAAARSGEISAGRRTSASGRTRARVAKPPWRDSPMPSPLRITRSPAEYCSVSEAVTRPTTSMPGISGKERAIPLPATAIASL